MPGEERPNEGWAIVSTVLGRLDRLSDELREDQAQTEARVMQAIEQVQRQLLDYQSIHASEHAALVAEKNAAHKRFEDFMAARELKQAREDGALGLARFAIDLLGRNWKAIVAIAVWLGMVIGNVRLDVVLR